MTQDKIVYCINCKRGVGCPDWDPPDGWCRAGIEKSPREIFDAVKAQALEVYHEAIDQATKIYADTFSQALKVYEEALDEL